MKHIIPFLYLFVFLCLFISCSTAIIDKHSYGTQVRPTTDLSHYELSDTEFDDVSWGQLFLQSMDAQVNGYGINLQVKIPRLSDSFSDEPLFIVNERNIGKGFSTISHIDPNSVRRIKVLRRPNEVSLYGSQGRHGVILIKTI